MIPPECEKVRKEAREFFEKEGISKVADCFEKNIFPEIWLEKFRKFGLGHYFVKEPYGKQTSLFYPSLMIMELARCESSSAAWMLANKLTFSSFEEFANED